MKLHGLRIDKTAGSTMKFEKSITAPKLADLCQHPGGQAAARPWHSSAILVGGIPEELQQQRVHHHRLLPLHPVPGARQQVHATHPRADLTLHALKTVRALVDGQTPSA